ncbi:HlyD family secretion protein [Streptomyces azureus]|uniref:HlyD family secretion protein n=1 Tax=Streptomyces azureus TaxID=146537 RepID=A0A0K8PQI3_STRAJ|nr:HlyD family secretion protein [Streptomyces azureus]
MVPTEARLTAPRETEMVFLIEGSSGRVSLRAELIAGADVVEDSEIAVSCMRLAGVCHAESGGADRCRRSELTAGVSRPGTGCYRREAESDPGAPVGNKKGLSPPINGGERLFAEQTLRPLTSPRW